jgi:hypothetical protein
MVLGKKIIEAGGKISYVADAPVTHIHEETYKQVQHRYYREALTLREVMPEIQMSFFDFIRFTWAGISNDISTAIDKKVLRKNIRGIIAFRFRQFWGSYKGQNENKKMSRKQKEAYYYPKISDHRHDKSANLARSEPLKQNS